LKRKIQAEEESLVQNKESTMEHYLSTCSMKSKNKIKLSRKEKYRARTRVCFGCKKKGHLIAACPIQQSEVGSDLTGQTGHPRPVRQVGAQRAQPLSCKNKQEPRTMVKSKVEQVQSFKDNLESTKVKHRTCYTCREKEHLGKDCPKGNSPNSNLVHYDFAKLRKDKAGTCAIRVINSPRTSIRAIWVPKHFVTNLDGPNKVWVPKGAC
jgi:hypothetical protein